MNQIIRNKSAKLSRRKFVIGSAAASGGLALGFHLPSGIVVAIVSKELVEKGRKDIPKIFQFRTHAENRSLYNTPPAFTIYAVGLVMKWLRELGGLPAIGAINARKAATLYAEIDRTGFFRGHSQKACRSLMNVTFRLPDEELEARDPDSGKALSDDEIRANILTFIAAGQETTANCITWTLYLLSQHEEARRAVEREVGAGHEPREHHLLGLGGGFGTGRVRREQALREVAVVVEHPRRSADDPAA